MTQIVDPLRKVKSTSFVQSKYSKRGQGSNMHTLSCLHVVRTKSSYPTPTKMRCRECGDQARQVEFASLAKTVIANIKPGPASDPMPEGFLTCDRRSHTKRSKRPPRR